MLELRSPYWDPSVDTSTRTSVVQPRGNPQQVFVQQVERSAFYNEDRIDPRYGIEHTRPAVLRPDPMWSHRWPDVGPYRGMTAKPFSWEAAQLNGLYGAVTQSQRDEYRRVLARLESMGRDIASLRASATTADRVAAVGEAEDHLERISSMLVSPDDLDDRALEQIMQDASYELDQLSDHILQLRTTVIHVGKAEGKSGVMIGVAAVAIGGLLLWKLGR